MKLYKSPIAKDIVIITNTIQEEVEMSIDDIVITPQKEVCEHLNIELSNLRVQISEKYDLVEILGSLRTVPDERKENLIGMPGCLSGL